MENNPQPSRVSNWLKTSITARMIMIMTIVLILLIPLAFIKDLIREREYRQTDVVKEINDKWGNSVTLYGPILKVPYKTYKETTVFNKKSKQYSIHKETVINNAYFFPKELDIISNVSSKPKKRNNYETVVYKADIAAKGSFEKPDFSSKSIPEKDIIWEKSTLIIKTSNLKGLKSEVAINLKANKYALETNFSTIETNVNQHQNSINELESKFITQEDLNFKEPIQFNFNLTYNGSKSIEFVPIGKSTTAEMTSNWKDPSFTGNFLPQNDEDKVNENGFKANWKIMSINRSFSQQFFEVLPNLTPYAFGAKLIVLTDEYQKTTRSAKYGFLVIGLTFLIFFLIQTLSKINIHAFQYVMIGIALIMFYTLLISISEHSSFLKSYVISGSAVVILITLYSKSILKSYKFMSFIGGALAALYSFIFVIIQIENYALLVGSIGLFLILAIVMYVSRKIDWSNS